MSDTEIGSIADTLLNATAGNLPNTVFSTSINDAVFQDFVTYRYLINPQDARVIEQGDLSRHGRTYLDDLEAQGASFETLSYVADFLTGLEAVVKRAFSQGVPTASYGRFADLRPVFGGSREGTAIKVLRQLYRSERHLIWALIDAYGQDPGFLWNRVFVAFLASSKSIHQTFAGGVMANPDGFRSAARTFSWAAMEFGLNDPIVPTPELEYDFEVFPAGTVNVGTALVYRQWWTPLGLQPGEIVKTVPLGPGQSQKITTKITRRRKQSRKLQTEEEAESSTENSDTTKDASELIAEAAVAQKWNVEAEASYSGIAFGGSVSAGYEASQQQNSKATGSNLSEVMSKTASRSRKLSKVEVATESELSLEEENATTLINANDEIAVTYYFHTLQQQYEVFTRLAEVRNVVYVAERVPSPPEINVNWVRRHDWILVRALLDPSFSEVLNELIRDDVDDPLWDGDDDPYQAMAKEARDKFAGFQAGGVSSGLGGLSVPDIYAEPQRQLDMYLREAADRRRRNRLRDIRRQRLFDHIRQNILHYCRAIWATEDLDQRLLRYRKEGRTVPVSWTGPLIQEGQGGLGNAGFEPDGAQVSLVEVLDVAGPIGFSGNYIVFPLRPLDRRMVEDGIIVDDTAVPITVTLPLQEVLDQVLRAPFVRDGQLTDPALDLFEDEARALIQAREGEVEENLDALLFTTATDEELQAFVSHMPGRAAGLIKNDEVMREADGSLTNPVSARDWGAYLLRRNNTRRFLVDSNNLYVSIHVGGGTALEPFKMAHRYLDVKTAEAELEAIRLKNRRREAHLGDGEVYDPDVTKVIVVGAGDAGGVAAAEAGQQEDGDGSGGVLPPSPDPDTP